MKARLVAKILVRAIPALVPIQLIGCMASAPPPKPAITPYDANFTFKSPAQGQKLGVTIGVVSPEFKPGAKMYRDGHKDDPVLRAMLSAMNATFNEVLVAKGFNTKGPFDSVDEMTFPDKKGSDLLLYPEFDFQVDLTAENKQQAATQPGGGQSFSFPFAPKPKPAPGGGGSTPETFRWACDAVVAVSGNISFIAMEPLSKEKMWVKKLDVTKAKSIVSGQEGDVCAHPDMSGGWTQEVKNAWSHAHEAVFQASMKALDDFVNGEEFQRLKSQSLEIRNRKTYRASGGRPRRLPFGLATGALRRTDPARRRRLPPSSRGYRRRRWESRREDPRATPSRSLPPAERQ